MNNSTIERKITIFISSKINERYNIVRKAIKTLLLETGMVAYVYAFETEGASSRNVKSAYLKEVSLSDLCIFLIDNADGVSDAVLAEHERAKSSGIHRLYFFCDENKKEITPLQKELMNSGEVKYYDKTHEFSDFSLIAYSSILQDIIDIYRGSDIENQNVIQPPQYSAINYTSSNMLLKKDIFKQYTPESELVCVLNPYDTYIPKDITIISTSYDSLSAVFLAVVLGQHIFDQNIFKFLKNIIISEHDENIKKIVELRLNALSDYFSNNLEECYSKINESYEKGKDINIPVWMLNDIAIDMRNVKNQMDNINNILSYETEGQRILDSSAEPVYYPLLDRYDNNSLSNLVKGYFDMNTDSPYSWRSSSAYYFFNDIASSYNISIRFGSLTHILTMKQKYSDILFALYVDSYDIRIYVELIKIYILLQEESKIKKIVESFNQSVCAITTIDIDILIESINTLPFPHKRIISLGLLLEYFGYYFNDEQYDHQMTTFLKFSFEWCSDERKIVNIGHHLLKTIKANIRRMDNQRAAELIICFFENHILRYYRDGLQIASLLDFTHISEDIQLKFQDLYISLMSENDFPDKDILQNAVIAFRKNTRLGIQSIEDAVKLYMPEFYCKEYDLEINIDNSKLHIDNYLSIAIKRNKEAIASKYSSFAWNPFDIIKKIIDINKVELNDEDLSVILSTIVETLINNVQQADQKNSAIFLLLYLKNSFPLYESWNILIEKLETKIDDILSATTDSIFRTSSKNSLFFNVLLMKMSFDHSTLEEVTIGFTTAMNFGEADFISVMRSINFFLSNCDITSVDNDILNIIANFILSVGTSKHKNAQYHAIQSLISLSKIDLYKTIVLERLAQIMNDTVSDIKISILHNIKNTKIKNKNIENFIVQKGRTDNHYLVRKLAEDITETLSTIQ